VTNRTHTHRGRHGKGKNTKRQVMKGDEIL